VATLDNLEDIIQNINDNLVPVSGAVAPTNSAVYEGQIYINTATGDVYIATATGGGPADWERLAYQSAIPTTPSLDDVLTVGNRSTNSIIIEDVTPTPTQTNTMLSDGTELTDTTQGLITNYYINEILVTDTATGDFLEIAIDNTQNQTITFPNNSGQLALFSDTVLTLQNVTDNGNLTTDIIVADSFSSTPSYLSDFASSLGYDGDGTTAHGTIYLREDSTGGGFISTIAADINLTADRTISIPDEDGIMMLNVTANTLTIKNNIAVPTQIITVAPTNVFIEDTPLDLQTSYNVNNIIVEDVSTGDLLQINIDNLQNQVIDFPDTSGKLALLTDIPPSVSYTSYVALLYQVGTAAPSAIVLENTLGGTITWARSAVGIYTGTITGAIFPLNKTVIFMQVNSTLGGTWGIQYVVARASDTGVLLLTQSGDSLSTNQDGYLGATPIEIRVYP